ncbi:MAG: hypothetical protein AVDCRST_MAG60-2057, partial [uncultured Nocardioides sp.]
VQRAPGAHHGRRHADDGGRSARPVGLPAHVPDRRRGPARSRGPEQGHDLGGGSPPCDPRADGPGHGAPARRPGGPGLPPRQTGPRRPVPGSVPGADELSRGAGLGCHARGRRGGTDADPLVAGRGECCSRRRRPGGLAVGEGETGATRGRVGRVVGGGRRPPGQDGAPVGAGAHRAPPVGARLSGERHRSRAGHRRGHRPQPDQVDASQARRQLAAGGRGAGASARGDGGRFRADPSQPEKTRAV